jgi:hypothetical protein
MHPFSPLPNRVDVSCISTIEGTYVTGKEKRKWPVKSNFKQNPSEETRS